MTRGPAHSSAVPAQPGKNKVSIKGYAIQGKVVHGNHIGRTLGFPTANIEPYMAMDTMVPNGVYLVGVTLGNEIYSGLCNIGFRPTIGGHNLVIEVNILDFSKDIYGQEIRVNIIRRIRKEKKFSGLEELVSQIRRDKDKALKLLSAADKNKSR